MRGGKRTHREGETLWLNVTGITALDTAALGGMNDHPLLSGGDRDSEISPDLSSSQI